MSGRTILRLALAGALLGATAAHADEIRLKDGTKISGTIVGFENGSFRVETSYGFALIEKDKVADINIVAAKKEPEPKTKANTPVTPPPAAPPAVVPAVAKEPASPASPSPEASAPPKPKLVAAAPPAPPPAPPPTPPPAPEPPVIRDEIRGNLYVNSTYGFQMYKPPSWDLIPAALKALPDAVAALGTYDQTTLLVVGREHAKDSLGAHAAATGKTLGGVYENYRLISTRQVSVAGLPAIEQRSRGAADGHDWSVILVTFLHGNDAFTLLGMTWADSDLIQVQENVISKTVNSLTFTPQ
jgi:outer membrane biosynthesis protein TonB